MTANANTGNPVRLTNRIVIRSSLGADTDHVTINCWCGRSVAGRGPIVDEAHRQHLQHHERRS